MPKIISSPRRSYQTGSVVESGQPWQDSQVNLPWLEMPCFTLLHSRYLVKFVWRVAEGFSPRHDSMKSIFLEIRQETQSSLGTGYSVQLFLSLVDSKDIIEGYNSSSSRSSLATMSRGGRSKPGYELSAPHYQVYYCLRGTTYVSVWTRESFFHKS